jgi:hypothetical protein
MHDLSWSKPLHNYVAWLLMACSHAIGVAVRLERARRSLAAEIVPSNLRVPQQMDLEMISHAPRSLTYVDGDCPVVD